MKILLIVVGVLLVVGLIVGVQLKGTYNELYAQREDIAAKWSQVDIVLQRRLDLIPNLVESVKGSPSRRRGSWRRSPTRARAC
jgi:LemA protein